MFGTIITLICLALAFRVSLLWWRSFLNPVAFGLIAWTPALVMLNWQPFFVSPLYIQLNRPVSTNIYVALALAFASFWLGCATIKALAKPGDFVSAESKSFPSIAYPRALALFGLGFLVFSIDFMQSGLSGINQLDAAGIADSRLALHSSRLSFLTMFMDITALIFFASFLRSGRSILLIPIMIALAAYGVTLQKSPIVGLMVGCLAIGLLFPTYALHRLWRPLPMRLTVIFFSLAAVFSMFWINDSRGMSDVQLTTASAPWQEQLFIYSGASAILNLSVTVDGYLPSDPAKLGLYHLRPFLWLFLDMSNLQISRYFEGVNTATFLIYGWGDFRWFGFFISPFLAGSLVMLYIRAGLKGGLFGLILTSIAFRALLFSPSTDYFFEPTVTIFLIISAFVTYFVRSNGTVASRRSALLPAKSEIV